MKDISCLEALHEMTINLYTEFVIDDKLEPLQSLLLMGLDKE